MEQKNNQFIINLETLNSEGDKKLEKFAKEELINIDDVIKIINNEAKRNGINDTVKVTFKTLEDDSFQIVVEKVEIKSKKINEIVIFPYEKIKSNTNEIILESYLGKVTLYNKEDSSISVTIDGVSLNLFSMSYSEVEELLCNISDRREKNGYIKLDNLVAYKQFGVVIQKNKVSNKLEFIEIYNKEEINKEYKFIEEKYDVDISKVGIDTDYKVPEFNPEEILNDIDSKSAEESKSNEIDTKEQLLENKLSERLKKIGELQESDIEIVEETEIEKVEEESTKIQEDTNSELDKEIEELKLLFEKQKEQQEILENRIKSKLEELISQKNSINTNESNIENKQENIVEDVDNLNKDYKSFVIESYKGLKEQGKGYLSVYLGQSKDDIRAYFKVTPKEMSDFEEMEMYDNFYAYYDEEDKCTGIGVYNQEENKDKVAIYLFGKNLITMTYKDIVKLIKDHDYKAIEDEDGIISLEYGISIDPKEDKNYKDSICDVIHVFKKGYYDEVYNI